MDPASPRGRVLPLDRWWDALEALLDRTGAPITMRRLWLEPWVQRGSWEPWLVGVPEPPGLTAAAPLARRRRRGVTEIVGLGHGWADHARLPATDPAAARALALGVRTELSRLRGPWRLVVEQLPRADPVARLLGDLLDQHRHVEGDGLPRLAVGSSRLPSDRLSKRFRYDHRRAEREARSAGLGPVLRYERDPRGVAALLTRVAALRRLRDHERGRPSDLDAPADERYWAGLCAALAARGDLEVATLWLGGELAAYNLGIVDGRVYRCWDGRIAPAWARYRPGYLLHVPLLDHVASGHEVDEIDLMRGVTEFKLRFADEVVPAESLHAWSSGALRLSAELPERGRRRWRRWRRQHPAAERGWRAARGALLRVTRR
jgi:CelD/BcsL family acetyltransferase involved in cellulose biosynthesis